MISMIMSLIQSFFSERMKFRTRTKLTARAVARREARECRVTAKEETEAARVEAEEEAARVEAEAEEEAARVEAEVARVMAEEEAARVKAVREFSQITRFVFKAAMYHYKIAKFIGTHGANIRELKKKIVAADDNLTIDTVVIRIEEDGWRRGHAACDGQKVLVTVSVYTDDREKSHEVIEKFIRNAIHVAAFSKDSGRDTGDYGW